MTASILFALGVQKTTEGYAPEVRRELIKVEEFLSKADTIQTIVSDRAQAEDGRELIVQTQSESAKKHAAFRRTPQTVKSKNLRGEDRKRVVSFFRLLTSSPVEGPAKCFFPRHSIFARKGNSRIDIQICYECVTMTVKSPENKLDLYLGMNRNSRATADKLFRYVSKNSKA
jgi:hypothetical protein